MEWVQDFYFTGNVDSKGKEAERLFVLLVGDTDCPDALEIGVAQDVKDIEALLKNAFDASGNSKRLIVHTLVGPKATKESIESYFNDLAEIARPTDAICFYYSGHGAIDEKRWKQCTERTDPRIIPIFGSESVDRDICDVLQLTHRPTVFVSDVKKQLNMCKSQCKILLVDACRIAKFLKPKANSELTNFQTNIGVGVDVDLAATAHAHRKWIGKAKPCWPIVRSTFLRHQGWISISSCVARNRSLGTKYGSLFTTGLLRSFYAIGNEGEVMYAPFSWLSVWSPSVLAKIDHNIDGVIQVMSDQVTEMHTYGRCLVAPLGMNIEVSEPSANHGLLVTSISADPYANSIARDSGLEVGDEIVAVEGNPIVSANDLRSAISGKSSVSIQLRKNGREASIQVTFPLEETYQILLSNPQ